MTFPLVFSLSYESFAKGSLTWQDNRSPWAGATTAINEEGEIGDRISAQHRAKETALDAVTMQITVFAGGDVAPQYLGHGGGEGLRGWCSLSGPVGEKGMGYPVPQANESEKTVRKSLWAYRSNPWMISSNGKTAMKILSVMLTDTFLKVHLKKLCNVILRALVVSNKCETWPWCKGAALAEDKTQSPVPASCRGPGCFAK